MAPEFSYSDLLPIGKDTTSYRNLGSAGISVEKVGNREILTVAPEAIAVSYTHLTLPTNREV